MWAGRKNTKVSLDFTFCTERVEAVATCMSKRWGIQWWDVERTPWKCSNRFVTSITMPVGDQCMRIDLRFCQWHSSIWHCPQTSLSHGWRDGWTEEERGGAGACETCHRCTRSSVGHVRLQEGMWTTTTSHPSVGHRGVNRWWKRNIVNNGCPISTDWWESDWWRLWLMSMLGAWCVRLDRPKHC